MGEITMEALQDMQKKQISENKKVQAQQKKQMDILNKMCASIDNLTKLMHTALTAKQRAPDQARTDQTATEPTAPDAANTQDQGATGPGEYVGIGARNKVPTHTQSDVRMMSGVPIQQTTDTSVRQDQINSVQQDLLQSVQNVQLLAQQQHSVRQMLQDGQNGVQYTGLHLSAPNNQQNSYMQHQHNNMAQNNAGHLQQQQHQAQQQYLQQQYQQAQFDQQQQQQQNVHQNNNSMDLDSFMNHYMNSTQQQIPQGQGNVANFLHHMIPKLQDMSNDNSKTSCQPYMFMQREGVKDNDYNKKFQLRESMDFTEYVRAYMNMLNCKNPPFPILGHVKYHLEHLEQLAEDNKFKRWEVVRKWSYFMFDSVEKGTITWENELKVQLERHRVQEAAERLTVAQSSSICKMYNAMLNGCTAEEEDRNCREHTVGQTVMKHICSFCHRAYGKSFNHPEWKCRNKRNNGNRNGYQNNERQQNQQGYERYNNQQNRQQYAQFQNQNQHYNQPYPTTFNNGYDMQNHQNQQQHWQRQFNQQFNHQQYQQNQQNIKRNQPIQMQQAQSKN